MLQAKSQYLAVKFQKHIELDLSKTGDKPGLGLVMVIKVDFQGGHLALLEPKELNGAAGTIILN